MADNGEWWRTIAGGEGGGGWRIRFGQRLPFKGVITHLTQKKEKKKFTTKREKAKLVVLLLQSLFSATSG